jgi:hypothetical protein
VSLRPAGKRHHRKLQVESERRRQQTTSGVGAKGRKRVEPARISGRIENWGEHWPFAFTSLVDRRASQRTGLAGQTEGAVDHSDVTIGLGKVAEHSARLRIYLFGE